MLLGHWPLNEDDIIQWNAGNSGDQLVTTLDATMPIDPATGLPRPTMPGSTVLIYAASSQASGGLSAPIQFTLDRNQDNGNLHAYAWRDADTVGGETAWSITTAFAASISWVVMEVGRLLDGPPHKLTSNTGSAATVGSGGIQPAIADTLLVAAHFSQDALGQVITWDAHTNGFEELRQTCTTKTSPSNVSLSVSRRFPGQAFLDPSSVSCSATQTQAATAVGMILAYRFRQLALVANTGFETALVPTATGAAGARQFDAVTAPTAMSIVTGRQGGGSSALRVNRTAAASLAWDTNTLGTGKTVHVERFWCKVDAATSVPGISGDTTAAGVSLVVSYVAATGKVRVQVGSGAAVDSDHAVALGTWFRVDYRYTVSGTQYTCEWLLDGVEQPDALSQTGLSATTISSSRPVGWSDAGTVDATYDDVADSVTAADYPIGDGRGIILGVDPAGTFVVVGAAADFETLTDNGATRAAFDAATARDAIDERPPTIGASADGFCQISASSSRVEMPMATYALQGLESVNGGRRVVCGWAAGTQAATLAFGVGTGTPGFLTNHVWLFAVANPSFSNSTTDPGWNCGMWTPTSFGSPPSSGGWDQAALDSLVGTVGGSGDATPDIGIHAYYWEFDIRAPLQLEAVVGTSDQPMVSLVTNTTDGATTMLEVATPADNGADVRLDTTGGAVNRSVGASSLLQEALAPSVQNVTSITVTATAP